MACDDNHPEEYKETSVGEYLVERLIEIIEKVRIFFQLMYKH